VEAARRGKIVDFVVPITLGCTRENADLDGNVRSTTRSLVR
jgi:hypothetical protein